MSWHTETEIPPPSFVAKPLSKDCAAACAAAHSVRAPLPVRRHHRVIHSGTLGIDYWPERHVSKQQFDTGVKTTPPSPLSPASFIAKTRGHLSSYRPGSRTPGTDAAAERISNESAMPWSTANRDKNPASRRPERRRARLRHSRDTPDGNCVVGVYRSARRYDKTRLGNASRQAGKAARGNGELVLSNRPASLAQELCIHLVGDLGRRPHNSGQQPGKERESPNRQTDQSGQYRLRSPGRPGHQGGERSAAAQ